MTTKKPIKKSATQQTAKSPVSSNLWAKKQVRVAVIIAASLLVIILLGYVSRGWLRVTLVPKTVGLVQAKSVKDTALDYQKQLGLSFEDLGFSSTKVENSCKMSLAQGFKEQLVCSYAVSGYSELPTDTAAQSKIVDAATAVQKKLQEGGWDGTYVDNADYASLHLLIQNLNKGIDYTPDAAYSKSQGSTQCLFDTNTAYASPAKPAMATHFSCISTVNLFGKPIIVVNPQLLDEDN